MNILRKASIIPWPLFMGLIAVFLVACGTVPTGVDSTQYRLREAQLNLDTIAVALPAAGYSEDDLASLNRIIDKVQVVLDTAATLPGADALELIQTSIPVLRDLVAGLPNERQRQDGTRIVATINLAATLIQNQRTLEAEFGVAQ